MMPSQTVAQAVDALKTIIEGIVPIVKPGRTFRVLQSAPSKSSPAQSRSVLIRPEELLAQGSYIGPCYAPIWRVVIEVCYPQEHTESDTAIMAIQDAAQIMSAITRPPLDVGDPWRTCILYSHAIEAATPEAAFVVSSISLDLEQEL